MSPSMNGFRYTHCVGITFTGGLYGYFDPGHIVDTLEPDTKVLEERPGRSTRYKCWLKKDTTLLISSILFKDPVKDGTFLLRLGGEFEQRPHDVACLCNGHITLPTPLPLPARMGFYLSIPDGASVTLIGKAASQVEVPATAKETP